MGSTGSSSETSEETEDFEWLDGDIQKSSINGNPSIVFSDRIFQIASIVVIKLLGRSVGFSVLQNKIYNLWKPSASFQLIDIENDSFLLNFRNSFGCEKVLSEGPWIIFGQCLTVQPWSLYFDPSQSFPGIVMSWIRLPGLPCFFYRKKVLKKIGSLVGKVAKLDLNTDNRVKRTLCRMAVYINLNKPLVSQVIINRRNQRIEYDFLPTVCFHCGKYGHVKENCTLNKIETNQADNQPLSEISPETVANITAVEEQSKDNYGPWMLVKRRNRRKSRDLPNPRAKSSASSKDGSRFSTLSDGEDILERNLPVSSNDQGIRQKKKGKV